MLKSIYAVQPYHVGSKHGKSLVICVPAKIAKECHIDTSTVFVLHIDKKDKRRLVLQSIISKSEEQEEKMMISAGKSLAPTGQ
jgi:hypothetical protein